MRLRSTNLRIFLQDPVSIVPHEVRVEAVGEEIHDVLVQVWARGVVNIPVHDAHPQLERNRKEGREGYTPLRINSERAGVCLAFQYFKVAGETLEA